MTTQEYVDIAAKYTAENLDLIQRAAAIVGTADNVGPEDMEIIQSFVREACTDVSARVAFELLQKGVLHDE